MNLERTCLAGEHLALGATLVDFNGWEMPIRYGSIPEEHLKVRLSAGLFDLCHMGRLEITGRQASEWVGRVTTGDIDALKPGAARYTLVTNDAGTIIDDAIVYKLPASLLVVVNASNRATVVEWMEAHRGSLDAKLIDRSREIAMVAVQGPLSTHILRDAVEKLDSDWDGMKYYSIAAARVLGKDAWIARTGYTGEDGFEVYLDAEDAPVLWSRLLEVGGNRIGAIGLGARDTLRLEAGMPLYGHELDTTTDPFEAGLGFAVKLEKKVEFVGQASLRSRREKGPGRKLTGFRVESRRVARQGMNILKDREVVGVVTSGAPSPTLGHPIAMGYLKSSVTEQDCSLLKVDIRGNLEALAVVSLPFYSRTRGKGRGTGRS